mmetsp:Transcript_31079/g.95108  ORF Transcript_31079/g.95108 Transcript_31079/m.95108 type:complete len:113 (-) Transcript_31079:366-704(-)
MSRDWPSSHGSSLPSPRSSPPSARAPPRRMMGALRSPLMRHPTVHLGQAAHEQPRRAIEGISSRENSMFTSASYRSDQIPGPARGPAAAGNAPEAAPACETDATLERPHPHF